MNLSPLSVTMTFDMLNLAVGRLAQVTMYMSKPSACSGAVKESANVHLRVQCFVKYCILHALHERYVSFPCLQACFLHASRKLEY